MNQIIPLWGRVIVKPDRIEDTDPALRRARAAGLEIPISEQKKEQNAQIEGVVISVGGNCFEDWKGRIPKSGERVIFDKFAGFIKKNDDEEYRIINDTDLIAVIE